VSPRASRRSAADAVPLVKKALARKRASRKAVGAATDGGSVGPPETAAESRPRSRFRTVGFGHSAEREAHHFVVSVPRSATGEVMIYEVFTQDPEGPALDAANLRSRLDLGRWLKVADALEEELNRRLRTAGLKASHWKAGLNPVARLLGKELTVLAWAIEDAEPSLAHVAIQNWRGLAPEERWWLYTMTAAQTGHHAKRNVGWRKAVRYALTENPTAPVTALPTSAERRSRALVREPQEQASLFPEASEERGPYAPGIWEEPA